MYIAVELSKGHYHVEINGVHDSIIIIMDPLISIEAVEGLIGKENLLLKDI